MPKSKTTEKELETVELNDVEILAPGKWQGNKTITITEKDIPEFIKSFEEISADKKLNYEPPAKLGHSEDQKILQADGYPAAGWVSGLREKAGKLLADFRGVPKKLAEIIKAGGYKKVSAEFYKDYEIGGKKYPWVLKAVAFLGADIPAVKTIDDIVAQYAEGLLDDSGTPYFAVTMGEVALDEVMAGLDSWLAKAEGVIKGKAGSPAIRTYLKEVKAKLRSLLEKEGKLAEGDSLNSRLRIVSDAYYNQTHALPGTETGGYIEEIFDNYLVAFKGGKYYQIPYSETAEGVVFEMDKAEEVKRQTSYVKASEAPEAADDNDNKNNKTEVLMEKELREILKLDEKADVLEAVKALVNKPEAVSLAEYTATKNEVTKLQEAIALKERDERVGKAISAGKITPAQKEWADKYALSDPKGFDAFIASAPKVIDLGEKGTKGGEPEDAELTEAEIKVAASMGVNIETLKKTKKEEK